METSAPLINAIVNNALLGSNSRIKQKNHIKFLWLPYVRLSFRITAALAEDCTLLPIVSVAAPCRLLG